MTTKTPWRGTVTSVQPLIRLLRSFDECSHSYLGYVLRLDGEVGGERRDFTVAIGKATHVKHEFQVGFEVSGEAMPVRDPRTEPAEMYKASRLKILGGTCSPCPVVTARSWTAMLEPDGSRG